jgi:hypothetical protein
LRQNILLLLLFIAQINFGQIIYSENFENGLQNIELIDNDKRTPDLGVKEYTQAWNITRIGNNKVASSNSWYNPPGKSDDWMILPVNKNIKNNTYLSWTSFAGDPGVKESYEVRISQTGRTLQNFTSVIYSTTNEDNKVKTNIISLKDFANKFISIAFRHVSNDKFLLHIDDINIFNAIDYDVEINDLQLEKYTPIGKENNIILTIKNV